MQRLKEYSASQTASARVRETRTNHRAVQAVLGTIQAPVGAGIVAMRSELVHKNPPQEVGPIGVGMGLEINEVNVDVDEAIDD